MAIKPKKKRNCTKGYSCGYSCISVKLQCRTDGLQGQSVKLAEDYFKRASTNKKQPESQKQPTPPLDPLYQESFDDWDLFDDLINLQGLSLNQAKAFAYWGAYGYRNINQSLIKGVFQDEDSEAAKYHMQEAWDKAPKANAQGLKDQVELSRKFDTISENNRNRILEAIKEFESTNTLYRGASFLPQSEVAKYRDNVGKEVQENIYFATSVSSDIAEDFGFNYRYFITPKKDTSARAVDGFKISFVEGEALYKPGTKFRVDDFVESPGEITKIYLTEV